MRLKAYRDSIEIRKSVQIVTLDFIVSVVLSLLSSFPDLSSKLVLHLGIAR